MTFCMRFRELLVRQTVVQLRTEMISLEDCIALCGLDEEQVLAIAEHEHIPEIAAAALADYLLHKKTRT